jgi:hypothetical protein
VKSLFLHILRIHHHISCTATTWASSEIGERLEPKNKAAQAERAKLLEKLQEDTDDNKIKEDSFRHLSMKRVWVGDSEEELLEEPPCHVGRCHCGQELLILFGSELFEIGGERAI